MNHPEPETWMSYLYGELEEPEQKEMTGHLKACTDCQTQVKSWQATMIKMDSWQVPSVTLSRRKRSVWYGVLRWSAAAAVLLAAGVVAGRVGASKSVNPEALQQDLESSLTASMRPKIEEDVRRQLSQEMVLTLASYRAQVSEALYRQIQLQLKEYAIQTLTASGTQTNHLLEQLLETVKISQLEERKIYGRILNQLGTEQEQLRNEFTLFARETDGRLLETQQSVAQLLTHRPKGLPQPEEPSPKPN